MSAPRWYSEALVDVDWSERQTMATKSEVLDVLPAADPLAHSREVEARVLAGAYERIHAEVVRAQQLGIIDEHGNLLCDDLPDDMQPGAQRDFGG